MIMSHKPLRRLAIIPPPLPHPSTDALLTTSPQPYILHMYYHAKVLNWMQGWSGLWRTPCCHIEQQSVLWHALSINKATVSSALTVSADNLPGSSNIVADWLSWALYLSAEWILNREIFSWLMEVLGMCQMGSVRNLTQPLVEPVFELEARPVCMQWGQMPFALVGRTKEDMPSHHLP